MSGGEAATAASGSGTSTPRTSPVKIIALLKRHPDVGPDEFRSLYEDQHALLVQHIPHVSRYVRSYVRPVEFRGPDHPDAPSGEVDVITELWFDSMEHFELARAHLGDVKLRTLFATDAAKVFDGRATCRYMVVEECETPVGADHGPGGRADDALDTGRDQH